MFFGKKLSEKECQMIKRIILTIEVMTGKRVFLLNFSYSWSIYFRKFIGTGMVEIGEDAKNFSVAFGDNKMCLIFSDNFKNNDIYIYNVFFEDRRIKCFDFSAPTWCFGSSFSDRITRSFDYDFPLYAERVKG